MNQYRQVVAARATLTEADSQTIAECGIISYAWSCKIVRNHPKFDNYPSWLSPSPHVIRLSAHTMSRQTAMDIRLLMSCGCIRTLHNCIIEAKFCLSPESWIKPTTAVTDCLAPSTNHIASPDPIRFQYQYRGTVGSMLEYALIPPTML